MDARSLLQTTFLPAGQRLHLSVDAGTVLLAEQGALHIDEAPRWLAERLVPVGRRLDEGQAYAVEQAGWICVTALGDARLAQVQPPGLAARLVGRLLGRRSHGGPAVC